MILSPPKPQIRQEGLDMRDGRVEWVDENIKPLGDRMIVRPLKVELSTTIEAHWRGRTLRGEVVAIGPGEFPNRYNSDRSKVWKSKVFRPTEVKVGDIVELGGLDIGGYAFPRIMYRGEEHIIASEKDVAGIHERKYRTAS